MKRGSTKTNAVSFSPSFLQCTWGWRTWVLIRWGWRVCAPSGSLSDTPPPTGWSWSPCSVSTQTAAFLHMVLSAHFIVSLPYDIGVTKSFAPRILSWSSFQHVPPSTQRQNVLKLIFNISNRVTEPPVLLENPENKSGRSELYVKNIQLILWHVPVKSYSLIVLSLKYTSPNIHTLHFMYLFAIFSDPFWIEVAAWLGDCMRHQTTLTLYF